jgi:hypothetical protein
MYNIDLYSYWKKPFTRSKKFTIHPLDEPGKEKYYSDQSHCTHYLKRTDPFVFKSILGVDYETVVRQQKEDIALMSQAREASTTNQEEVNKNNNFINKYKCTILIFIPIGKNLLANKEISVFIL